MKELNSYWKEKVSGRRILITGGTTGIGREITLLLTSLGANCLICGRNQQQIDETITEANKVSSEGSCKGIEIDLANEQEIKRLFEYVDDELGGIDVLVNNAAIGYGSVAEGGYADWSYAIHTNLLSYMACSSEASKRMESERKGHIIHIGSMSADVREEGSSVYVASKSGIQGFSEALRKELNPKGIKVSLIEPGATDTDMQDGTAQEKLEQVNNQEMLKSEDIAMAVGFCLAQADRCDVVSMQIKPHLQPI